MVLVKHFLYKMGWSVAGLVWWVQLSSKWAKIEEDPIQNFIIACWNSWLGVLQKCFCFFVRKGRYIIGISKISSLRKASGHTVSGNFWKWFLLQSQARKYNFWYFRPRYSQILNKYVRLRPFSVLPRNHHAHISVYNRSRLEQRSKGRLLILNSRSPVSWFLYVWFHCLFECCSFFSETNYDLRSHNSRHHNKSIISNLSNTTKGGS